MKKMLTYLLLIAMNGYAQEPLKNDIIVNEVLFNPKKEGFDYIECFNRSIKTFYLNSLLIANPNVTGDISGAKLLTKDSIKIEPGVYVVITANEKWLKQNYSIPSAAIVCQVSSMPSFPDDEGSVLLLGKSDSNIIDETNYSEKWHFIMIADPEGVALERINYDSPGQDKNNWTSASSASGYGTPGSVNSQFRESIVSKEEVSVLPKIFSPDNDGVDDFAQVNIGTREEGKTANAIVYDTWGRRVRYLLKNELLGANNRFTWDGCDDHAQKLPTGIYIVCTQVFDTKGNNNKFRHCIVLSNLKR